MSNYLKKFEEDYNNNKISLSQLHNYRTAYNKLSDEEKESLDNSTDVTNEKSTSQKSENPKEYLELRQEIIRKKKQRMKTKFLAFAFVFLPLCVSIAILGGGPFLYFMLTLIFLVWSKMLE